MTRWLALPFAPSAPSADANSALVLRVLPALLAVLAAAALCGALAVRLRQPRVLGEIAAGVVLGPSVLGAVLPGAQRTLFGPEVKPALYLLGEIGLTLFMFLAGVGLDPLGREDGGLDRRDTRRAVWLGLAGMLPTLLLGVGVGRLLYGTLSRPDVSPAVFALFLGGALSITAFPTLARILYERGHQHTRLGRISLLAASIDDAVAWCLLALVTALHAGGGPGGALRTLALAGLFAAVMLVGVARLLRPLGRRVERTGRLGFDEFYVVVAVVLASGLTAEVIGVHAVFGGFVAGLAMPRGAAFRAALRAAMMDVVCVLLLPVYFAFSGLGTRLGGLTEGRLLLPFLLILAAAFAGKLIGCGVAMRAFGFSWGAAFGVGSLMNARGLMILVFINIGLAQGIITSTLFSMLVLVALLTTAAAVPLYRRVTGGELGEIATPALAGVV